jgi:hypothetical protein
MATFEEAKLSAAETAVIAAALAADPELADELEELAVVLDEPRRQVLWRGFAAECGRCTRPAAAVLPALERLAGARPVPPGLPES